MGTDTTDIPEPVLAADQAAGAGSVVPRVAPPSQSADVLRALTCAVLISAAVGSPGAALVVAPFVPTLVAIRVLRQRAGSRRFLVLASVLGVIGAAAASEGVGLAPALATALALVPVLGFVHAGAAYRDPVVAPEQPAWPEPRIGTGFLPTVVAWLLVSWLVVAAALPAQPGTPRETGRDIVRSAYSTEQCRAGGAFEDQERICEQLRDQRRTALDLVDDHGAALLAALVSLFAFGAAATAHPIVLSRARRSANGSRIRPSWRLRELEVHWSAAYVLAAGLLMTMAAPDDGMAGAAVEAAGIGASALGGLLVILQGVGLGAWLLLRTPRWYRWFVAVASLFVLPAVFVVTFLFGVVDLAFHPRRRFGDPAIVAGRGSGS